VKTILEERFVARYDRFRQRIAVGPEDGSFGRMIPHFDMRAHVRRYALPEPGDMATLQTLVSAIINEPLDRRKPLWRYLLLEDVERRLRHLSAAAPLHRRRHRADPRAAEHDRRHAGRVDAGAAGRTAPRPARNTHCSATC
jgi:hypothetical protein